VGLSLGPLLSLSFSVGWNYAVFYRIESAFEREREGKGEKEPKF
jgi:hypothetical protein